MKDKFFQSERTANVPKLKMRGGGEEKNKHFDKLEMSWVMEERKSVEEKLHFQARVLDLIEQAVLAIDLDGKIVYWNPYAEKLFGWSAEEVRGQSIAMLGNPPVSRIKQIEQIIELIKKGKSWSGDIEVHTRDGSLFPIQITNSPLYDETGRISGIVGIASDARERKRTEEALLASEKKYRSVVNSVREAIFQTDEQGMWTFLNPAWTEITGYSVEESLGTHFLNYIYEDDRAYYNDLFHPKKIDRHKAHYAQEIRCQTKAGEIRWLEIYSRYILDDEGRIIGTSGMFNDITEQKRAEQNLRKMQEELRQSQKMEAIGRLAGGVAHDFSNLLTVIACCTEIIVESLKKDDPLLDIAQEIQGSAERAVALTRQLLLFSHQQMPETRPVDLNHTIENIDKLLKRLLGDEIKLIVQAQPQPANVRADAVQLDQVIMNLVINARDAMPEGGKILIETADVVLDHDYATSRSDVLPGPYVLLSISDTGSGMSEEVKSHIFEPYFTTKAPSKGTGLGLSSVYAIVKQSGGHIRVYSEIGLGTTFKIYLPRATEAGDIASPPPSSAQPNKGATTILIVDDDIIVRQLLRKILERQGYQVLEAWQGDEALAISQSHAGPIELMITDIVMPGMNGQELARHMAQARPQTRVLFTSGYSQGLLLGPEMPKEAAFLQKPYTSSALLERVAVLLKNQSIG